MDRFILQLLLMLIPKRNYAVITLPLNSVIYKFNQTFCHGFLLQDVWMAIRIFIFEKVSIYFWIMQLIDCLLYITRPG